MSDARPRARRARGALSPSPCPAEETSGAGPLTGAARRLGNLELLQLAELVVGALRADDRAEHRVLAGLDRLRDLNRLGLARASLSLADDRRRAALALHPEGLIEREAL